MGTIVHRRAFLLATLIAVAGLLVAGCTGGPSSAPTPSSASTPSPPPASAEPSPTSAPVAPPTEMLRTPADTAVADPVTVDLCAVIERSAAGPRLLPRFQQPAGTCMVLQAADQSLSAQVTVVRPGVLDERVTEAEDRPGFTTTDRDGLLVHAFTDRSGVCVRVILARDVAVEVEADADCQLAGAMADAVTSAILEGADLPQRVAPSPSLARLDLCRVLRTAAPSLPLAPPQATVDDPAFGGRCTLRGTDGSLFSVSLVDQESMPHGAYDVAVVQGHRLYTSTVERAAACAVLWLGGSRPGGAEGLAFTNRLPGQSHGRVCAVLRANAAAVLAATHLT